MLDRALHVWPTCCDVLHQDGRLGAQAQTVRVELRAPLDLNREAEGVAPLVGLLPALPVHRHPVSGQRTASQTDASQTDTSQTVS